MVAVKPAPTPAFSVIVPIAADRTPSVLASLERLANDMPCEVLTQVGPNPSRNRNESVRRAHAAILAFTDDDCHVAPDWLVRAAGFFAAHPEYDAVGGPQLTLAREGVVGRASGYALASWFGTWRLRRRFRRDRARLAATEFDLTAANLFVTRRAFEQWGPFDEDLWPNEETALLRRIEQAGGKIAYDPAIVVFHKRRDTLVGFARQCFGYGRGRARQLRREPSRRPTVEQTVPCAFLAYLLALPILLAASPLTVLPLAAYAAVSLSVAGATAVTCSDPAAAALMPLTLLLAHVAYPAGFLIERARRP